MSLSLASVPENSTQQLILKMQKHQTGIYQNKNAAFTKSTTHAKPSTLQDHQLCSVLTHFQTPTLNWNLLILSSTHDLLNTLFQGCRTILRPIICAPR